MSFDICDLRKCSPNDTTHCHRNNAIQNCVRPNTLSGCVVIGLCSRLLYSRIKACGQLSVSSARFHTSIEVSMGHTPTSRNSQSTDVNRAHDSTASEIARYRAVGCKTALHAAIRGTVPHLI